MVWGSDSQLQKGQTRIQDKIFNLDAKIPADHIERVVKAIQDAHRIAMESFKQMGREFADQKDGNQAVLQDHLLNNPVKKCTSGRHCLDNFHLVFFTF